MRLRLALLALLLVGSACARPINEASPRPNRSLITKQELSAAHFATVYDAVQGLRGNWLITRGADSFNTPTQVKVYLDNSLLGGVDMLKNISPSTISFIRYYDGIAATSRWGLDHGAGAIVVSTIPEKSPSP